MVLYLVADLGRYAGELRVGGEVGQVVHRLDQRAGGLLALLTVVLVKGSVQGLGGDIRVSGHPHTHTHTHTTQDRKSVV